MAKPLLDKHKKLWNNWLSPSWQVLLATVIAILSFSFLGTMILNPTSLLACLSNTFSGIGFGYLLICLLNWIRLKKRQLSMLQNPWITSKIVIFTGLSSNLIYSLAMISMGIYTQSPWYLTVALYHIVLAVQKFFLGYSLRKHREDLQRAWQTYGLIGYLILIISLALIGTIILVIHQEYHLNSGTNYAILMAVYTFTISIASLINAINLQKLSHPLLMAERCISFISSLFSIFTLQTIMLQTFNTDNSMNWALTSSITGFAIFVLINLTAILMIIRAKKEITKTES